MLLTSSIVVSLACQPIVTTEGEVAAISRRTLPGSSGKYFPGTEGREAVEAGAAVLLEPEQVIDENVGESKELHGIDENPPLSAKEVEIVEDNAVVVVDGGRKEEKKEARNQDEDIYRWIEDVRRLAQS